MSEKMYDLLLYLMLAVTVATAICLLVFILLFQALSSLQMVNI